MKIYISHSKNSNFKDELYSPLRKSKLNEEHVLIFPHQKSDTPYNSKENTKTFDLVIAEVSNPSLGVGIELGWADSKNIPIIAVFKKGSIISDSIKVITTLIIEYSDSKDLISKLKEAILNI
ncbi:hypothetical protein GOV12_04750 [Candidatus Pacearchaeota archaeon]|nr:hypothetical protein [Candidatus Pacearchaeota archaeon]